MSEGVLEPKRANVANGNFYPDPLNKHDVRMLMALRI